MKSQCIDEGTLRAYQDGALSPADSEAVAEHLQECALCRLTLSEQQLAASQASGLLGSYLLVPAPAVDAAFQSAIAALPAGSFPRQANNRSASIGPVAEPLPSAGTDRRALPWKPGRSWLALAGVGIACAVLLALALPGFLATLAPNPATLASPDMTPVSVSRPSNKEFTPFVPAGKVRHMVFEYTIDAQGSEAPRPPQTEEVWLANGQEHLLMRREVDLTSVTGRLPGLVLVNDEAAWYYDSGMVMYNANGQVIARDFSDATVAYRMDYSPDFLVPYVPNEALIADLLQQSNTHITATGTLNGRPYNLVESTGNATFAVRADRLLTMRSWSTMPIVSMNKLFGGWGMAVLKMEPVPPGVQATPQALMTPIVTMLRGATWPSGLSYSLWVDSETSRILRIEFGSRVYTQDASGTTDSYQSQTISIKTDELLDASTVPPDLFTFSVPASRQIVQAMPIFTMPSPPGDYKGEESSWEAYRSPDGDFMAIVPGGETSDTESGGWHLHNSVNSALPVTFTVAYRDLDAPVSPDDEAAQLEAELTSWINSRQGMIKSTAPATLSGHAGKEVTFRSADNTYTRLRLFLVGKRLYAIYASALDERVLHFAPINSTNSYTRYDVGVGTFLSSLTLLSR